MYFRQNIIIISFAVISALSLHMAIERIFQKEVKKEVKRNWTVAVDKMGDELKKNSSLLINLGNILRDAEIKNNKETIEESFRVTVETSYPAVKMLRIDSGGRSLTLYAHPDLPYVDLDDIKYRGQGEQLNLVEVTAGERELIMVLTRLALENNREIIMLTDLETYFKADSRFQVRIIKEKDAMFGVRSAGIRVEVDLIPGMKGLEITPVSGWRSLYGDRMTMADLFILTLLAVLLIWWMDNRKKRKAMREAMERRYHDMEETQEKVWENEALLNSIVNNIRSSVWAVSKDYRIIYINREFKDSIEHKYGIRLEKGDNILKHEDLLNGSFWKGCYDRALSGEHVTEQLDMSIEGEKRNFALFFNPIEDEWGEIQGVSVFSRDITELASAKKEAEYHERVFKELIASSPIGITVRDSKGGLSYANRAWRELWDMDEKEMEALKYQREELRFNKHDIYLGPHMKKIREIYEDGGSYFIKEAKVRTRKKKWKWISQYFFSIETKGEGNRDIVIMTEDITDIKIKNEKLISLENAIDRVPESIVVCDEKGDIQYVNKAFSKREAWHGKRLIGNSVQNLFAQRMGDDEKKEIDEVLKRKEGYRGTITYKTDQRTNYEYISVTPVLDQNGDIKNIVGIFSDVTERRDLERQLQQAQRMESLGTLAGGIAHDFNNILASIIGHAELMMLKEKEDGKGKEYLTQILKSGERAKNLIQQILMFSRPGTRDRDVTCVRDALLETVRLLRATYPPSVNIDVHMKKDYLVSCDETKFMQIIMNICTNAYQALKNKKGNVVITVDEETAGDQIFVRISVEDDGEGMENDVLSRIFEPYFTTNSENKGTGLGLSIVHGIIKAYGGDITAQSRKGEGTVFTILLPVVEKEEKADTVKKEKISPKKKLKILLIDDEKAVLSVLTALLEHEGHSVRAISDSEEALDIFFQDKDAFDLVITDYHMKGINGIEAAKIIHRTKPGLEVILMSGNIYEIDKKELAEADISRVLGKPIEKDALYQAINGISKQKYL